MAVGGLQAQPAVAVRRTISVAALEHIAALVIVLGVAVFVVGAAWDIQWHTDVGRDRILTMPHLVLLSGIAVAGLASLAVVLGATWRAARGTAPVGHTIKLGPLTLPFGFAVAGVGALLGGLAFPLDDYWHTLYGIDVTLWSPFHVMIICSPLLAACGALYALADLRRQPRPRPGLDLSIVAALGVILATALIFIVRRRLSRASSRLAAISTSPIRCCWRCWRRWRWSRRRAARRCRALPR